MSVPPPPPPLMRRNQLYALDCCPKYSCIKYDVYLYLLAQGVICILVLTGIGCNFIQWLIMFEVILHENEMISKSYQIYSLVYFIMRGYSELQVHTQFDPNKNIIKIVTKSQKLSINLSREFPLRHSLLSAVKWCFYVNWALCSYLRLLSSMCKPNFSTIKLSSRSPHGAINGGRVLWGIVICVHVAYFNEIYWYCIIDLEQNCSFKFKKYCSI